MITCNVWQCGAQAAHGAIYEHNSGNMTATPVYYFCEAHSGSVAGSVRSWTVSPRYARHDDPIPELAHHG